MNKVVSININRKRLLGAYYAQNNNRIPEDAFFFTGVILSMGLPEGFYSVYGGLVPFMMFAGSALVGSIWGVARYRRSPAHNIPCINTGTMPRAPQSKDTNQKKAA